MLYYRQKESCRHNGRVRYQLGLLPLDFGKNTAVLWKSTGGLFLYVKRLDKMNLMWYTVYRKRVAGITVASVISLVCSP